MFDAMSDVTEPAEVTSNLLITGVSAVTVISPAASSTILSSICARPPAVTVTFASGVA